MLHHTPKCLLDSEPCLVELSFAISLEAMLIAQGPISVEVKDLLTKFYCDNKTTVTSDFIIKKIKFQKLNITMKHTKFTVHEGLYSFLTESKNVNKYQNENQFESIALNKESADDILLRITPIIPKVFAKLILYTV